MVTFIERSDFIVNDSNIRIADSFRIDFLCSQPSCVLFKMKCALGEGVILDILRDDLSSVDIIEQKLSAIGREVCIYCISTHLYLLSS